MDAVKSIITKIPGFWRLRSSLYPLRVMLSRPAIGAETYRKAVFIEIWANNYWGDAESRSGAGSSRQQTAPWREDFARLLEELDVRRLLDVPCGDFNWMKEIRLRPGLTYVGGDIVEQMIEANQSLYGNDRRIFQTLDLLHDRLPESDLILCKDCLVHFSFSDIFAALSNLKLSGGTFLLTTHFERLRRNADIFTGGWRPLNLTRPPFNFPPPRLLIDEQYSADGGQYRDKRLALWRLDDLPEFARPA